MSEKNTRVEQATENYNRNIITKSVKKRQMNCEYIYRLVIEF